MWISDYFMSRGYWYRMPKRRKVDPVEKPGDPAYQAPKNEPLYDQKGKRDFSEKDEKTEKISGKNLVDLWV